MEAQEKEKLDYEIFDRQLEVFVQLTEVLVKGWKDYGALELSMDIHSLCRKGARLFYMADQDWTEQQNDLLLQRFKKNATYLDMFEKLVHEVLCPAMHTFVQEMQSGGKLSGVKLPYYDGGMTDVFPLLQTFLTGSEMEARQFEELLAQVNKVFEPKMIGRKKVHPGETSQERFCNLLRLFVYACYLNYHFKRCVERDSCEVSVDQLERIFMEIIQHYAKSDEGKQKLQTYRAKLLFEHDGVLSAELLHEAEKQLVHEVPASLQLCFMTHSQHLSKMAGEIAQGSYSREELEALTEVVAKSELLHCMEYELKHPVKVQSTLYNEVIHEQVKGKPVNLKKLCAQMASMVRLVERKNHWFCVWSVLRHHLLLKDLRFEPFARQMMHDDWFGKTEAPRFTGDNLGDYRGYFDKVDFMLWNKASFEDYRLYHNKKAKWNDSLFSTFYQLAHRMEDAFQGLDD